MNKDNLKMLLLSRLVLILLAVNYIPFGLLIHWYSDNYVSDPMSLRLILTSIFTLFFILTFISRWGKSKHQNLEQLAYILLTIHITYLFYINNEGMIFGVMSALIVGASPASFYTKKSFYTYLSAYLIAIALMIIFVEQTVNIFYFIAINTIGVTTALLSHLFLIKIYKKLLYTEGLINNTDAIVIAANSDGIITFVSEGVTNILGYTSQELLKKGWWSISNNKLPQTSNNIKQTFNRIKDRTDRNNEYINEITHKNGAKIKIRWHDTLLSDGSIVGIGHQVKSIETSLYETYKASDFINISGFFLNIDKNNILVSANNNILDLLDKAAKVINTPVKNLFAEQPDFKNFEKQFELSKSSQNTLNTELKINAKGQEHKLSFVMVPITEKGEHVRTLCFGNEVKQGYYSDLTEKEQYSKDVLHELDRSLFTAESIETILTEITLSIRKLNLNIHRISISHYNLDEELVNLIYTDNVLKGNVETHRAAYPMEDSRNTISIISDAEYAMVDLNNIPTSKMTNIQRKLYNEHYVNSYITFPIKHKSELIGAMNYASKINNSFDDDTIEQLKTLSKNIETAVYQYKLKETIKTKNKFLEQRNKDITDSIRYAQRIQKAFMTSVDSYHSFFKDSFVYILPKDTLSGDFFWVEDTPERLWIAGVDCTGHGVPGALVSIIGANILNQAIYIEKIKKPNNLLAFLNKRIIQTFQQSSENTINDGMDIAVCCIEKSTNTLYFSGVLNHLIFIRDGKMIECNANRIPIGSDAKRSENDFELHEIKIMEGDKFYLFSDGYADQFGGEKNKKFGPKKFKQLILDTSDYAMSEQKRILSNSHNFWKLDNEQTDDILILGFSPLTY